MGYAEDYIARLVVFLLDIRLDKLRKRLVAGLVALNDFTAFLINYDNVIVFVNNFHIIQLTS